MLTYFFKRVLHGIPVLVVVATLTFVIMRLVPGGPFDEEKKLPPEILANIQAKYHLDEPVITQYLLYLKQLTQGDMGPSYKYIGRDVTDIISDTFPVSITLSLSAMFVVVGDGVPTGMWSAYRQHSMVDRVCVFFAMLGVSVPSFVLGTVLVWLMSHKLHWFPPALWEGPRHMILPALALGAPF
jgi:oligopeptide transport system permease protein